MEFNIALNTIVYLMLFLFPGILFRKFYFRAAHSKQFDQGNLFERFIWTVLSSVFILFVVIGLFIFVRTVLSLPLLQSLSYETIKEIFDSLGANELPEVEEIETSYFDFLTFLSALYLLSIIFGFLSYLLNSKVLNLFKYNNYWENVIKGTYKKNSIESNKVFGYVTADVLVDANDEAKLYSGRVVDYFLAQSNNKLETIVLSNVFRYKKIIDEKGAHVATESRKIPGDNFCVDTSRVLNLNLTYVSEEKETNKFYKRLKLWIDFFYGVFLVGLVLILYLDLEWIVLSDLPRKIVFFILTWTIVSNLLKNLKYLIVGKFDQITLIELVMYIFFGLPYLWLAKIIPWYWILALELPIIWWMGTLLNKEKAEKASVKASKDSSD